MREIKQTDLSAGARNLGQVRRAGRDGALSIYVF